MVDRVVFSSDKDNWETPDPFFQGLTQEFHFGLDVAASPENAKVGRFYTESDDALGLSWASYGPAWCNPPYGRGVTGRWIRKGWEEAARVTVVFLIPARTDLPWWHDFVMRADEIRFVRGRIRFVGAKSGAPFPSAVVVFRSRLSLVTLRPSQPKVLSISRDTGRILTVPAG